MDSRRKALKIAGLALGKQAEKVVLLNVKKLSAVTDYIMICSAGSTPQVQAIADAIGEGLKGSGVLPLGVEGTTEGRWALLDYNDVVAHIFLEPVRVFYDIEGLWAEAPSMPVVERDRGAGLKGRTKAGGRK